jgi:Mor family transcriptional regulator
MSYKRADEILPTELIKELHKYVSGECLYIPVKYEKRVNWSINSGYRQELDKRDRAIYESHQKGVSISELSDKYFLSEKSIYRIISKMKSNI